MDWMPRPGEKFRRTGVRLDARWDRGGVVDEIGRSLAGCNSVTVAGLRVCRLCGYVPGLHWVGFCFCAISTLGVKCRRIRILTWASVAGCIESSFGRRREAGTRGIRAPCGITIPRYGRVQLGVTSCGACARFHSGLIRCWLAPATLLVRSRADQHRMRSEGSARRLRYSAGFRRR
jgi:hypothetical protein